MTFLINGPLKMTLKTWKKDNLVPKKMTISICLKKNDFLF